MTWVQPCGQVGLSPFCCCLFPLFYDVVFFSSFWGVAFAPRVMEVEEGCGVGVEELGYRRSLVGATLT